MTLFLRIGRFGRAESNGRHRNMIRNGREVLPLRRGRYGKEVEEYNKKEVDQWLKGRFGREAEQWLKGRFGREMEQWLKGRFGREAEQWLKGRFGRSTQTESETKKSVSKDNTKVETVKKSIKKM